MSSSVIQLGATIKQTPQKCGNNLTSSKHQKRASYKTLVANGMSTSYHHNTSHHHPPPASVARRNERERNRVKMVNMGFATLRQHVPNGAKNKKMSKVETLRSAVEYIRELQKLLGQTSTGIMDHEDLGGCSTPAIGSDTPATPSTINNENIHYGSDNVSPVPSHHIDYEHYHQMQVPTITFVPTSSTSPTPTDLASNNSNNPNNNHNMDTENNCCYSPVNYHQTTLDHRHHLPPTSHHHYYNNENTSPSKSHVQSYVHHHHHHNPHSSSSTSSTPSPISSHPPPHHNSIHGSRIVNHHHNHHLNPAHQPASHQTDATSEDDELFDFANWF